MSRTTLLTSAGERTVVKLDRLPRKMLNNQVLVEVDFIPENGHVHKTESGLEIEFAGGEYNESAHIARYGTVKLCPDRLVDKFTGNFSSNSMDWTTEIEIVQNDVVYFGKMASANAIALEFKEKTYFLINYSELILRVRDGVVYPLNGYALLEKKTEKTRIDGLILDFGDFHDKESGIVTYVGRKNERYFGVDSVDADISVGDDVVFGGKYFGFVEEDMFASLPKETGYVQRRWIIGKL